MNLVVRLPEESGSKEETDGRLDSTKEREASVCGSNARRKWQPCDTFLNILHSKVK
jgi:hypothetical protein